MDLFRKISDIFELKSLNFKKQTKKTLLNWAKRVKFEKRREKYFQNCGEGKILSKVSICKQKDRPEWTQPLEGQKVKDIRRAIKAFLSELGLLKLDEKDKAKIEKLSEEKHWESIIVLSENSLEDRHKRGGARSRPNRVGRDGRQEANPRFPHVRGQQTLRFRRGRSRQRVKPEPRSPSPPEEWDREDNAPLSEQYKRERGDADYWKRQFEEREGLVSELLKFQDKIYRQEKKNCSYT